jgi:hypothetical protein
MSSIAIRWFASTITPARETAAPCTNTATKLLDRHATATVEPLSAPKITFPIDQCPFAAGSFIRDFRTPPAPETLQAFCQSACRPGSVENGHSAQGQVWPAAEWQVSAADM